ncbi:Zinc finger protein AZF2 [Carex littledalei]|uniref:Zinc finger protein AZF2 n=1 Tax=Carex littledalei TaxID=544730 RepID=A0A833RRC9_9POAL|nr:Zinc finger protein AZF2 [Carex littledalei]
MSAQPNDGKPPKRDLTINTSEEDLPVAKMLINLSKGEGKVHQCKRCQKIFPSGEALGGNQRKYYKGPLKKKNNPKAVVDNTNIDLKPEVVIDDNNIDLKPKVAVINNNDFDLNKPSPPDNS